MLGCVLNNSTVQELLSEYHHFFPRAAKAKAASPSFTNFEAWRAAILRTQKTAHSRTSHPAQNIKAAVARLGCWSSSSSTVERSFEETTGLRGGQSEDEFVERERDILIIRKDPLQNKDRIAYKTKKTLYVSHPPPRFGSLLVRMGWGAKQAMLKV